MEKDNRSKIKHNRTRDFKKQHYQNISKNQNSSKTIIEKVITVQPKQLELSDEEDIDQGDDFSLLQNSNSGGGFFTFSSEKNWDSNDLILNTSKENTYFTLNLNLLTAGLQTIPFYNRMNYPLTDFTEKQINLFNDQAQTSKNEYNKLLDMNETKTSRKKDKTGVKVMKDITKSLSNDKKNNESDELFNLSKESLSNINLLSISNSTNILPKEHKIENEKSIEKKSVLDNSNTTDDLQDWLDTVLE